MMESSSDSDQDDGPVVSVSSLAAPSFRRMLLKRVAQHFCLASSLAACLLLVGLLLLALHLSSLSTTPCSARRIVVTYTSLDWLGRPCTTAAVVVKPLGFSHESTETYPVLVWAHGGWRRATDEAILCAISEAGYVAVGPQFQGNDGVAGNERDFMGSMMADLDGAISWAVAPKQAEVRVDARRVYLAGEELGAAAVMRYINQIGLDGKRDRLQRVAVANVAYNTDYQLRNSRFMEAFAAMVPDLQRVYGYNSSQDVVEGLLRARSPHLDHEAIVDSVLVAASTDRPTLVAFENSNDCARDLSRLPSQQPFRYVVYANGTAAFQRRGQFYTDMFAWFSGD